MGSGAAMTRLKTCCWASVEALIADRADARRRLEAPSAGPPVSTGRCVVTTHRDAVARRPGYRVGPWSDWGGRWPMLTIREDRGWSMTRTLS